MSEQIKLNPFRIRENKIFNYRDTPRVIDTEYLKELKIDVKPTMETLQELQKGSFVFAEKYKNISLVSKLSCIMKDISLDEPLKNHRYTCKCPIDVLEINPMIGCNVNCLYCLVSDGDHSASKILYNNYKKYLRHKLKDENGIDHCYYFAPKTEPFQEATLQTGIAHDILREFIAHFKNNPNSKSYLFVLTKAGKEELYYKNNGETILDLMGELSDKLIYDTSISMMPPELYPILEPRAATIEERLEATIICQEHKIHAHEAVIQPIIPTYLSEDTIRNLFMKLKNANILKIKPEFLTLTIQNLAWIGEIIRHTDKSMAKELYELYIAPENINNFKHKFRIAPDREFTRKAILNLKKYADEYELIMTICHWVRNELNISDKEVPLTVAIESWDVKPWGCKR